MQCSTGRARSPGDVIHRAAALPHDPAATAPRRSESFVATPSARHVQETLPQTMFAGMGGDRPGVDRVVHHDADDFSSPPSSAPLPLLTIKMPMDLIDV